MGSGGEPLRVRHEHDRLQHGRLRPGHHVAAAGDVHGERQRQHVLRRRGHGVARVRGRPGHGRPRAGPPRHGDGAAALPRREGVRRGRREPRARRPGRPGRRDPYGTREFPPSPRVGARTSRSRCARRTSRRAASSSGRPRRSTAWRSRRRRRRSTPGWAADDSDDGRVNPPGACPTPRAIAGFGHARVLRWAAGPGATARGSAAHEDHPEQRGARDEPAARRGTPGRAATPARPGARAGAAGPSGPRRPVDATGARDRRHSAPVGGGVPAPTARRAGRPPGRRGPRAGAPRLGVAGFRPLGRRGGPRADGHRHRRPADADARARGTHRHDRVRAGAPDSVLDLVLRSDSATDAWTAARALEAYQLESTPTARGTTRPGSPSSRASGRRPRRRRPPRTTSSPRRAPTDEGDVEVAGEVAGRYAVTDAGDGRATVTWRNDTAVLQATGPADVVADVYAAFPL